MLPSAAPPFALYLHVPFCGSLCGYCSFNKHRPHGDMERYVDSLLREAGMWRGHPAFDRPQVTSVFVGGGTPSFLPSELFTKMLRGVLERFDVGARVQVSCEANPESSERARLRAMRDAGVTRLSIGVQTFDEVQLRRIGRRHHHIDVKRAVSDARELFDEVSIDLMYGQPDQTQQAFERDLERAIALPITHLSFFPFVHRPDTIIGRRKETRIGRDNAFRMYDYAVDRLAEAGFTPYTSEDFTRTGTPCRYQVDAWEPPTKGTLGLGAGALSGFGAWSWHDLGSTDDYIAAIEAGALPIAAGSKMSPRDRRIEHILLGLHTLAVHPERFEKELGVSLWRAFGPAPILLRAAGLLQKRDDGAWTPTRRGAFAISYAWTGYVLDQLARAAESPQAAARSKKRASSHAHHLPISP
jgi:oxygen-independent coproporphyrinogen-3 oxidase